MKALNRFAIPGTLLAATSAWSAPSNLDILVAPPETPAAETALKAANGKTVFSETRLFKALELAASKISVCQTCTVTVKVAAGAYRGKMGTTLVSFPDIVAPKATLRILGGFDDAFSSRSPFQTPTIIRSTNDRTTPVLQFEGRNHALKALILSGFTFDVALGNRYDVETNSLLKSASSSDRVLELGYLTTDRLQISDNVFMNAAAGVAAPMIRAASPKAEVHVSNNVFLNNVTPWVVESASSANTPARYVVSNNSFILNWPMNPDANTSDPGALKIGSKYAAKSVEIAGNLFAFNAGGAIYASYADNGGPHVTLDGNLFWENGTLFDPQSSDEAAVVGKFNGSGKHLALGLEAIEDLPWTIGVNESIDPDLDIPVLKLEAVKYVEEGNIEDIPLEEIEMDEDFGLEDIGVDGRISNYAPRMPFAAELLPFPRSESAQAWGARANLVGK